MRTRKSKIEGERGSTSITTSTRSSWKTRRRRGRDGMAAQRWPELGRNFNGGGAARVCGGGGFGSMGVQGVAGRCFYSTGLGLGVRATPSRGGARSVLLPDSGRVRVLPEVGDDGRAPRDRGREGAGPDWPGGGERAGARKPGHGKGSGPRGEGKRKSPFHFLKQIKLFQFKFKHKDSNLS